MKEDMWEKKPLTGMELNEKPRGVIGIGNIGTIVAEKTDTLGMRVIA